MELAQQFSRAFAISSNDYVCIIAGLTDEVLRKIDSFAVYECLRAQLKGDCQIIPYDDLLKRFDEALPVKVFTLSPLLIQYTKDLETIVKLAEENLRQRQAISGNNSIFGPVWRIAGELVSTWVRLLHA